MPKFIVEQYETHVQRYAVEAKDKSEAILAVWAGKGKPKGKQTYVEVDEDDGMPPECLTDAELAKVDKAGLYDRNAEYIRSIKSVEEAK